MKPRDDAKIDAHVGARLKARREAVGMSQSKLGELVDKTFQAIQKYEKGTIRPSGVLLFRIGQRLGVPVAYFFDGLEDGATTTPSPAALKLAEQFDTIESDGLRLGVARHIEWCVQQGAQ